MNGRILTIGHSNHPIDRFIALLKLHSVTAVADVRSGPFSRRNPQFNKAALKDALKAAGIEYVFLGKELGARSSDRSCYENGRVQYARLALSEAFRAGITRVRDAASRYTVALMCAEKEPLDCHRTLLVAHALEREGEAVVHIHPDGYLESHPDAMRRLLHMTGVPRADLFRSEEELIEEAIRRQAQKIAYVDKELASQCEAGST